MSEPITSSVAGAAGISGRHVIETMGAPLRWCAVNQEEMTIGFYPAIQIGTFEDCYAALASVGITGQPLT